MILINQCFSWQGYWFLPRCWIELFLSRFLQPVAHTAVSFIWPFFYLGKKEDPIDFSSVPDNAQLRVYYAQVWILTHRLEIRASSWHTHTFKTFETVSSHSAQQWNQIGKVQNAKFCLPNHIPVCNADWFNCCFQQLYFKADWSEIHFFSTLAFPFYALVFTSAENMSRLPGLHEHRSAWQQSLMKVLLLRETEVIKTCWKRF